MKKIHQLLIISLALNIITCCLGVPGRVQASNGGYGVVGFVSSLPSSSDKNTLVAKSKELGSGWVREEYTYSSSIDFSPYDSAYSKIHGSGLKILGLLTYPSGTSHTAWRNYVEDVVKHFPGVSAWEVMNEADNYLSASDYVSYLKEAHSIIKDNGGATVVLTGLSARKEVYPFWDEIKTAGGWDYFDVVGLHMFHNSVPTEDSYNNGTLSQEVQKVVNSINKNGGGKSIWITELGYDSDKYGLSNEAKWLVQSLDIIRGYSEVEKVFIFRLFDHGNGLGLLTSSLKEKEAYGAVKNWLAGGGAPSLVPAPTTSTSVSASPNPPPTETTAPTPIIINKEKSYIRVDGNNLYANSQDQYRIVVGAKDADGKMITSLKPGIILGGGQTTLTDFTLVGEEWFAYVSSNEPGERTAQINVASQDLGKLNMTFMVQISTTTTPTIIPLATNTSTKNKTIPIMIWYIAGGVSILALATFLIVLKLKGSKSLL